MSIEDLVKYINEKFKGTKALKYPGGDWFVKNDIIQVLVKAPCNPCTLVEVFGGSGVISQYAPRSKFKNVVYNDIDNLLFEFFKTVKENPGLLQEIMALIPYSRSLRSYLQQYVDKHYNELKGLVAASFLFYLLNTGFDGGYDRGFAFNKIPRSNEAHKFGSNIEAVIETAKRFRDVVVENLDFYECISKYDSDKTVFYLDPPYVSTSIERDYYRHGFTPHQAKRLSWVLNNIKGYYVMKLHEDQLKYYSVNYKGIVRAEKTLSMGKADEKRDKWIMVLLTNYDI